MVLTESGIAHLAVYDDPQTDRAVDYLELYDYEGNLLLAQWVDTSELSEWQWIEVFLEGDGSGIQRILSLVVEGNLGRGLPDFNSSSFQEPFPPRQRGWGIGRRLIESRQNCLTHVVRNHKITA